MKNRITSSVLLAGGLALLALPSAFANSEETLDVKLRNMDANGDGKVSRAEFEAYDQQKFAKMDANGDGAISLDEMSAYNGEQGERTASEKFKKLDTNGDGKLSAAEHKSGCTSRFSEVDTDGDGYVTLSELTAAYPTKATKAKKY